MFFGSGCRAYSLTALLAAAVGCSTVSTAGVSGLSYDGGMGGEDGADAFRISMRSAICFQPGLDVGISELVVGAIVREFVVWRGESRFKPRSPPTLSS